MAATDPASVARSYLASFSSGNPQEIAAHVTHDFVNEHTSALGDSCAGRDEYLRRLPGFLGAFVGLTYEVEDVVTQDQRVFVSYTMQAIADGSPVNIRGVVRLIIRDGLVAHRTEYFDSLTFLRQTGQAD